MDFVIDRLKFPPISRNSWYVALDDDQTPTTPGVSSKQYGEWFSADEAGSVEAMTVFVRDIDRVSNENAFEPLRDLSRFTNLKYLNIPVDAIGYVDIESVASKLEYLRLSAARLGRGRYDLARAKKLQFFGVAFPSLKSLYLSEPPICFHNFDVTCFPSLRWIEVDLEELDKTARSLRPFHDIPTIEGFGLNSVFKTDILKDLNRSLIALEFGAIRTRSLDLRYLAEFPQLKYLTIVSSRVSVDARFLANIPSLTELEIVWLKRLEHVEALLESPSLQRVSIRLIDEGQPDEAMCRKFAARFKFFEFK